MYVHMYDFMYSICIYVFLCIICKHVCTCVHVLHVMNLKFTFLDTIKLRSFSETNYSYRAIVSHPPPPPQMYWLLHNKGSNSITTLC